MKKKSSCITLEVRSLFNRFYYGSERNPLWNTKVSECVLCIDFYTGNGLLNSLDNNTGLFCFMIVLSQGHYTFVLHTVRD